MNGSENVFNEIQKLAVEKAKTKEPVFVPLDSSGMTDEQKERMRLTYHALNVLNTWRDMMIVTNDDPENEMPKWLGVCIKNVDLMIKEWAFAIGHPVAISNDTLEKIVDKVVPEIGNVIKQQIRDGKL